MSSTPKDTPLQIALVEAGQDKRQAEALRQMVIYAFERAELSVVIRLGILLDSILDDAAKCPPKPETLIPKPPEQKAKARTRRTK